MHSGREFAEGTQIQFVKAASMPALSIRLFGRFSVCCGDEALQDLIPGKAKELLCYLLTHRQRPLGREFLASTLWDDCTTEHSKQYLRKALWQLQRALCSYGAAAEPVVQIKSQWVSVSPEADIWVDVAEFERFYSGAQNPSSSQDESRLEALEAAVDLYRGDLLEGWYQDWCLYDRERLQNIYLGMLDKVVSGSEANHEYEKGIDYATRILRCDRAHETAHQQIMHLRYMLGDRAGALRQYENCAAALKEELGVHPSERTRKLYQQIREDRASAITAGPKSAPRESEEERSPLAEAIDRLVEVKNTLAALQNAVDESLIRVRQALQSSNRGPGRIK
jgi:DNA-binding SARP family transcriptional activator